MENNARQSFTSLVDSGMPVGEVTSVVKFLVTVKGLQPASPMSVVIFENGSRGYIQYILEDSVTVLHLGSVPVSEGMLVVLQGTMLSANVGKDFVGRVISASGEPLDGKGPIAADAQWPVFNNAPAIHERKQLDKQMETGVALIDALFPIVRGQKMALLGDAKAGKSTLATQIAINQKNTDQIAVYVMISKRRSDLETLLTLLTESGALAKSIVVVSDVFDSLVNSYLAPYIGCALAEYLWQTQKQDAVIIYDDLTNHAYVCREIALLSGTNPGRDSYPGDIFHTHSSLLERSGKLLNTDSCLTAIALVLADGGDITAYLPTNIMAITDGQWVLDMEVFRDGQRPALNSGLSVTRVGGRGHNSKQKSQNEQLFKMMSAYEQSRQFAQFGAEMSAVTQQALVRGRRLRSFFTQSPGQVINLMTQQLCLDVLLGGSETPILNVKSLIMAATEAAKRIKTEQDYAAQVANLTTFLSSNTEEQAAPKRPPSSEVKTQ